MTNWWDKNKVNVIYRISIVDRLLALMPLLWLVLCAIGVKLL